MLTPPPPSLSPSSVHPDLRWCRPSQRLLVLHTVQLLPHRGYDAVHTDEYLRLSEGEEAGAAVAVEDGGGALELCLAQNWSAPGGSALTLSVAFRGLVPSLRK